MFLRSLSFLCLLLFSIGAYSQAPSPQEVSVTHTRHIIKSAALGEDRSILVRVPPGYNQGADRYPVVYMLDGHAPHTSMMPGILDNQAWGGQIPEMILVSIQNKTRTLDLTPTQIERYPSGRGDKFLDFIQTEVMPLVEKNYRTQPFRVFAGHSLGGLFVVYSFVARPEMFNAYIAASPALYYDKNLVIKRAEEMLKQKKEWNKTMYLGVGDEPIYTPSFDAFKDVLDKANASNFTYEFHQFKEENHSSGVLYVYTAGLRKIFKGWALPPVKSLKEMEDHYRSLSKGFGYEVKPPEDLLNQLGFEFLRAKNIAGAIEAFKRNTEIYPASANTYDSLASAYEADGKLKQARDLFEKAYKMAETSGETMLAKSSKANFERLNK